MPTSSQIHQAPIDVKLLLQEHLRAVEARENKRLTLKEFAEMIGYDDKLFNHLYNKRRPLTRDHAKKFADYFEDPRFYDAAGIPRPDPDLQFVQSNWEDVPDKVKRKIREEIERYTTEKSSD